MSFNKIFMQINSEHEYFNSENYEKIIHETFRREAMEGRKWGDVFRDAVRRNVDLECEAYTLFGMEDNLDKEIVELSAIEGFKLSFPHINLEAHTHFIIWNDVVLDGTSTKLCILFVLV